MHCIFQSGPGEDSECSYQEEMIMVKMACMLITLIWSLHVFTQTETSRPVPYFMSTKRKEKQERDQIYSTSKRKRKQHWDNHIGVWRDGQWLKSHAAPAEDRLVLSTHVKLQPPVAPGDPSPSSGLHWRLTQTHRHTDMLFFKNWVSVAESFYIHRVSPICWWCGF